MKDSKLVGLFKNLTAEDLRQIKKMLSSPFFTSNSNLLSLFRIFRSVYPEMESKKIEKKALFKKLFPNHEYSDIKLRNLSSEFVKLIEEYFLIRDFRENQLERHKNLLRVYKDRQLYDQFEKLTDKMLKELEKQPYRDEFYYRKYMDIRAMRLEFSLPNNNQKRFEYLLEWDDFMEQYYLLSKNRIQLAIKAHLKIFKNTPKVKTTSIQENVLLTLFQYFDALYEAFEFDLFLKTKEYFELHFQELRRNNQDDFLKVLINFAIRRMALDDKKYSSLVFDLYRLGLENGFYIDNKQMSGISFFNIVVCACKAEAFDWTATFIKDYSKYLPRSTRMENKKISLSYLHFYKQEYEEAIDLLVGASFIMEIPKTVARTHLIRCYYELYLKDPSYYDVLYAEMDSFERYLRRRDELPKPKLDEHLHFLSFIKKVLSIRNSKKLKPKQKDTLHKELEQQEHTVSRSWLKSILEK